MRVALLLQSLKNKKKEACCLLVGSILCAFLLVIVITAVATFTLLVVNGNARSTEVDRYAYSRSLSDHASRLSCMSWGKAWLVVLRGMWVYAFTSSTNQV